MLRDQECRSRGADDADAAATTIQRVGAARTLIEMPNHKNRGTRLRCEVGERGEGAADVLIPVGIHFATEIRHERIDDDQPGLNPVDAGFEGREVIRNLRKALWLIPADGD